MMKDSTSISTVFMCDTNSKQVLLIRWVPLSKACTMSYYTKLIHTSTMTFLFSDAKRFLRQHKKFSRSKSIKRFTYYKLWYNSNYICNHYLSLREFH